MLRSESRNWEKNLSMVGNEATRSVRPRKGVTLLRPVFMNAVEVGYSYAQCDRDKRLNVRGVTIALWHFICRGHQAIALLPYCFKSYAEKSSCYSELMTLHRLNLIEFTPGYGSEKYAEVNRIMVNRAFETGGCIVARSQMQGITEHKPNLVNVVEQRLLMPTFNGDDIMFPIDGPLGRNGPSLKKTLECEQADSDWRLCLEHQLLFTDQRHWMEKISQLAPEKVAWIKMSSLMNTQGSTSKLESGSLNRGDYGSLDGPVSSEDVSSNRRVEKKMNRKRSTIIQSLSNEDHIPSENPFARHMTHLPSRSRNSESSKTSTSSSNNSQHTCTCSSSNIQHPPETQTDLMIAEESTLEQDAMIVQLEYEREWKRQEAEQRQKDELLARLSQIFGYKKSSRVLEKHATIRNINALIEKCLQEEDREDDDVDIDGGHQEEPDLIDFDVDILTPLGNNNVVVTPAPINLLD